MVTVGKSAKNLSLKSCFHH